MGDPSITASVGQYIEPVPAFRAVFNNSSFHYRPDELTTPRVPATVGVRDSIMVVTDGSDKRLSLRGGFEEAGLVPVQVSGEDVWQLNAASQTFYLSFNYFTMVTDATTSTTETLLDGEDVPAAWNTWYEQQGGGGNAGVPATLPHAGVVAGVPNNDYPSEWLVYLQNTDDYAIFQDGDVVTITTGDGNTWEGGIDGITVGTEISVVGDDETTIFSGLSSEDVVYIQVGSGGGSGGGGSATFNSVAQAIADSLPVGSLRKDGSAYTADKKQELVADGGVVQIQHDASEYHVVLVQESAGGAAEAEGKTMSGGQALASPWPRMPLPSSNNEFVLLVHNYDTGSETTVRTWWPDEVAASAVVFANGVNLSAVGTYTNTYTAIQPSGGGLQVSRTVILTLSPYSFSQSAYYIATTAPVNADVGALKTHLHGLVTVNQGGTQAELDAADITLPATASGSGIVQVSVGGTVVAETQLNIYTPATAIDAREDWEGTTAAWNAGIDFQLVVQPPTATVWTDDNVVANTGGIAYSYTHTARTYGTDGTDGTELVVTTTVMINNTGPPGFVHALGFLEVGTDDLGDASLTKLLEEDPTQTTPAGTAVFTIHSWKEQATLTDGIVTMGVSDSDLAINNLFLRLASDPGSSTALRRDLVDLNALSNQSYGTATDANDKKEHWYDLAPDADALSIFLGVAVEPDDAEYLPDVFEDKFSGQNNVGVKVRDLATNSHVDYGASNLTMTWTASGPRIEVSSGAALSGELEFSVSLATDPQPLVVGAAYPTAGPTYYIGAELVDGYSYPSSHECEVQFVIVATDLEMDGDQDATANEDEYEDMGTTVEPDGATVTTEETGGD